MAVINHEKINVKFVVNRISFRNEENYFTILKATFKKYDSNFVPTSETVIKGYFVSVFIGDEYEGVGHWVRDSIYGWQFIMEQHNRVLPSTSKELRAFLSKFIKGIGAKTANAIVDFYKENTLKAIEEGWENILKVKGISEKKAQLIYKEYMNHKHFEDVALFMLAHDVEYKDCLRIYETFGPLTIPKILENPYCLSRVDKIGFLTADKIAKRLGHQYNSPGRIQEAILYYMEQQMIQKGHLYIPKEVLNGELNSFLETNSAYKIQHKLAKEIDQALKTLENNKIMIENDRGEECVYLKLYNLVENRIVTLIQRLVKEEKPPIVSSSQIHKYIQECEKTGFKFATAQKEALFMALQNGISIITGAPGTGKTQTLNSIIQCVESVKKDAVIELSAPTGKASKRMTEMTGKEAKTIHRLIGLFEMEESDEVKDIEADLLIVDESSMIDAYVFYKLLTAIEKHQTRVLFVGDFEQLPSVGPGLIFRDLICSKIIPTTRLSEIFRQAKDSQIVMNAHAILEEDSSALSFDHGKGDFFWMETTEKLKVQTKILNSIERLIQSKRFKLDDIQVLVPIRKGELGTDDLNRLIQERFNKRDIKKHEYNVSPTTVFRAGDKVMQTINNYQKGVFNGEVGVITEITKDEDYSLITVDFGDKMIGYKTSELEELVLAYAISIHKSQGSEFKCVIMPIHDSQRFMLNKNLIYTGITRAREMVALIGQRELLNTSILKTDNSVRNSRIKEKLIKSI